MLSAALICFLLLGFGAPWTWVLCRQSRGLATIDVIDRVAFGYAISFVILYVAAQLRLWLFVPVWIAGALACVCLCLFVRPPEKTTRLQLETEAKVVMGCAALYALIRSGPFFLHLLPVGWDAYFHMTLAESILARGRAVYDWLPYEDMPLNYPIGAHLWMALMQWVSGVRPHEFFNPLLVLFVTLSGIQLYSLGARATQSRTVGLFAALAYLFLADMGSLAYTQWSGLPNAIGMYLFLALLSSLTETAGSIKRQSAVFVVYFLAICFIHHHVMVTAGLCLAWTAAAYFISGDRTQARRIVIGLAASGLVGAPYFLMYALRAVGIENTSLASYKETMAEPWGLVLQAGLGFTVPVVGGVYVYFKRHEHVSKTVTQPLVAMLCMYVAVEFIVRTASVVFFHHEISPFTPSRFITDSITLLSVFAGMCFRSMQGQTRRASLTALVLLGFLVFNRATFIDTYRVSLPRAQRELYEWVSLNTDPDAVVIDRDWRATYLSQRMSSGFPLPTSEYTALARNRALLRAVGDHAVAPASLGRQVVGIVENGKTRPHSIVLQRRGSFSVIELATRPRY